MIYVHVHVHVYVHIRVKKTYVSMHTNVRVHVCASLFIISDFYDEGYRRGDNSECVSTDGNEAEKRVRNGLVIACFVLSLLVVVEWSVCAALWRCGVVDGSDSPDG